MKNLIILIVVALSSLTAKAGLRDAIIQEGAHRGESLFNVVAQTVSATATYEAFNFFDLYQGRQRTGYVFPLVPEKENPKVVEFDCKEKHGKCTAIQKVPQTLFTNTRYLMIFDLNKPSTMPRLHVVDLRTGEVASLFASHGTESSCPHDLSRACKFISNRESNATPLGFFMTGHVAYGDVGWMIPLYGLQGPAPGFERNDIPSTIVIHANWYAEPSFREQHGYMGRSLGCPTLSSEDLKKWMNSIQDGALFYFFHDSIINKNIGPSFMVPVAKK